MGRATKCSGGEKSKGRHRALKTGGEKQGREQRERMQKADKDEEGAEEERSVMDGTRDKGGGSQGGWEAGYSTSRSLTVLRETQG